MREKTHQGKKSEPVNTAQLGNATDVTGIYKVAPAFKLERIYQIPKDQGSWVGLTLDHQGNLWCCYQHGKILKVTLAPGSRGVKDIMPLDVDVRGAHGLLWHDGVLWACANEGPEQTESGKSKTQTEMDTQTNLNSSKPCKAVANMALIL